MNSLIALSPVAPQSTGHPLSLPANAPNASPVTTVRPVASGDGSDVARGREFSQQQNQKSKRELDKPAPPSMLQIKIEALLNEQAEELARAKQEAEAAAKPEIAETPPAAPQKVEAQPEPEAAPEPVAVREAAAEPPAEVPQQNAETGTPPARELPV